MVPAATAVMTDWTSFMRRPWITGDASTSANAASARSSPTTAGAEWQAGGQAEPRRQAGD
eukprot:4463819-Prymnesium_polylepis.1